MQNSVAVVTICTQGIGEQYAYELAKKNMNIILMDKNLDKLNEIASKIRKSFSKKMDENWTKSDGGESLKEKERVFVQTFLVFLINWYDTTMATEKKGGGKDIVHWFP